jgi:hypothetical protein
MRWVRIHANFDAWASIGPAPTFTITSDDDGEAFIEIAKRPELLYAPVSDPDDAWNVYFSSEGSNDGSVASATIPINRGMAQYTLPTAVWQQMSQVVNDPDRNNRRLYYRVKARPRGASSGAWTSHTDADVQSQRVPFVDVFPLSGDLRTMAPVGDAPAEQHLDDFCKIILAIVQLLENTPEHRSLQRLIAHPTYSEQSSPTLRAKVLQLFVYAGGHGRQLMERLMALRVSVGTRDDGSDMTEPAIYYRDERNEATLVEHLIALWDVQLDRRIPLALSDVIFEVISELIDPPGQLNQGAAGTCAATTIQAYTAVRNPAEYARWCRYLLDRRQNHSVQLANGDRMRANAESFDVATWRYVRSQATNPGPEAAWQMFFGRTYSERAVQAAVMDFANFRHRYDPERDNFRTWLGQTVASGLWEFEMSRAIEAIFNQPWRFDFGGGSVSSAPNAQAAANLISHFENGGLPVLVAMRWGTGGHAVLGLRVENNRVIFRNPQYRGSYPPQGLADGAAQANPTRTIHNIARAEESMDLAGLQAALRGYCLESASSNDRGYTRDEIPTHLHSTVNPTA